MKSIRFPIRLKIMISLLFGITAVVIAITFTMAGFFHEDKRSYMNDWISIAAVSTAEESRALLTGYAQRLDLVVAIMLDERISSEEKSVLVRTAFEKFPELVSLDVYRDGTIIESASDPGTLEAAGLTADDVARFRSGHLLPEDRILAGETVVENATITEALPCIALSLAHGTPDGDRTEFVSALIRSDPLMRTGAKFRVFEIAIAAPDGTLIATPDPERVARHETAYRPPVAGLLEGEHSAGMAVEYERDGTEMIGAFANVGFAGLTVSAQVPKTAAYLASRDLLGRLLMVASIMLLVIAVTVRLWSRRITRPLERLSGATRAIGKGEFDVSVDVTSRDEIGDLAGSFNTMASELYVRETALKEANAQLLQSEKMAAFGQLGAGIAHEVKNPLAGILGCAQLSLMDVDEGTPLYKNLSLIEKETERCKTIIENLLKFARQEKAARDVTQLNTVVEDAAAIVNHQLEINLVKLERDHQPDLPAIWGNANQIQQVLMNLFVNAQQAMDGEPGRVRVSTRLDAHGRIEIRVSDTGPGIPPEIRHRLFDPFFTTKPAGQGTGLGLSVSFGIIKDHGGEITVESEPGKGATFLIRMPVSTGPARAKTEVLEAATVA